MPSAAAMSFLVRFFNSAFTIRVDRSSNDPSRWSRQISAALIASTSALVSPRGPKRRPHQRQAGLALSRCRPFDRLAGGPPAGAVLDACGLVEHGDRAPADAEPHIDLGCDGQPQRQRRIDREADRRERALEFVADRERGRVDRVIGDIAKGVVHQPMAPARSATVREPTTSPMRVARKLDEAPIFIFDI